MFGYKLRLLVLIHILGVCFSSSPWNAVAGTPHRYDGRWEATFVPTEGACSQHTIELRVSDGAIGHGGDVGFFTASGEVSSQGQVDASIGTLGIAASARGQLSEDNGRGTWNFPDRGCTGQWTARRLS